MCVCVCEREREREREKVRRRGRKQRQKKRERAGKKMKRIPLIYITFIFYIITKFISDSHEGLLINRCREKEKKSYDILCVIF